MKPTLLILAAGMANRYGSMKQVDGFGPSGETIIDYSIYDAINAGFGKIIFIIREEFKEEFKAIFEPALAGRVETDYINQNYNLKPFGIKKKIERTKPWGTAHAILSARDYIKEPFCVINADDFYSYDAFKKMVQFLSKEVTDNQYALIGYQVGKTLSDYGSVSRGVCQADDKGNLIEIIERTQVYYKRGNIVFKENEVETVLPPYTLVSMNFWGFSPAFFKQAEPLFRKFVKDNENNSGAEFFISLAVSDLIKSCQVRFKLIPTYSTWFGVTYKEDKSLVQKSISKLIEGKVYPFNLSKISKNIS